jgi:starch synthase
MEPNILPTAYCLLLTDISSALKRLRPGRTLELLRGRKGSSERLHHRYTDIAVTAQSKKGFEKFMNIAILTKEYPPYIYGGAGVHVKYLTREFEKLDQGKHRIHILCFGDQRERSTYKDVTGVQSCGVVEPHGDRLHGLIDTLLGDVAMVSTLQEADVIHCHTWYTHLAGCLLKPMLKAPLVLTTHSLEPHRPWKKEQLAAAYGASLWLERTAYENADGVIAVSAAMKEDVHRVYGVPFDKIEVIHNGIDDGQYHPVRNTDILKIYGIDPDRPFVLTVARLTRQKGITHFLEAAARMAPSIQVVMCASSPDTPQFMEEVSTKFTEVSRNTANKLIWVKEPVPPKDLIALYSHAAVFVCPSIYEPFGITNLEAMACGTPVVASAVGGILEVVEDRVTGLLVPFEPASAGDQEPKDRERFALDLASAVNSLITSPGRGKSMGTAARQRVKAHFTWKAVARKTLDFYENLAKEA